MAEAVGLTAACLQLAEVAIKTGSATYNFVKAIKSAPKKAQIFRNDLRQALAILNDITELLRESQVEYTAIDPTLNLVKDAIQKFNDELKIMSDEVAKAYENSKGWRSIFKIGIKGDKDWEQIEDRMSRNYRMLTVASGQLSNVLGLENGKRITKVKSLVQDVSIQIDQTVSAPIHAVQTGVQNAQHIGETSVILLRESMALQTRYMQRSEELHEVATNRITELHDNVIDNQSSTTQSLQVIQNTCDTINLNQEETMKSISDLGVKYDNVAGLVQKLADDLGGQGVAAMDIATQSKAILEGLKSLQITRGPGSKPSTSSLRTRDERVRLENQKKALSAAIRRIQKLAENDSPSKILKADEAEDSLNDIQQILDIFVRGGDGEFQDELVELTAQLLGSSKIPLYVQKAPDMRISKLLRKAEVSSDRMLRSFDAQRIERNEIVKKEPVEGGMLVISLRKEKRWTKEVGEEEEAEKTRALIEFRPDVQEEDVKIAFMFSVATSIASAGASSVPPLIRIYHRRGDSDDSFADNPFRLVRKGDLAGLKRVLTSGKATLFDCNLNGNSLLYEAVAFIKDSRGGSPGNIAICEFLIEEGLDPNIPGDDGR
ncbi:hypothetical protein ABW19_dt0206129 [Dactylella cylindrospora]|nr:hypothetical protein ABW19_dt0206129 [Dactylella cylindrospora]